LAEFYKTLLRQFDKRTAEYWYKKFNPYCLKVNLDVLKKAIDFQHDNRKTNISLFDAVGYIFSIENNMEFITSDKKFKNKPNVKFIK
jgi:hypothetical protein